MRDKRRRGALLIVESNWHGAHRCEWGMVDRGIPVHYVTKGRPSSMPGWLVTVRQVAPWRFQFAVWSELVAGSALKRWDARWDYVIVDTERMERAIRGWCGRFWITVALIKDSGATKEFTLLSNGRVVTLDELTGRQAPLRSKPA